MRTVQYKCSVCYPSTQMVEAYLDQLSPEEASPRLLTVDRPGFNPEVLHVEGHRCEDGLAVGEDRKRFND